MENTYTREELEQAIFDEAKEQLHDQGVKLNYAEADTQYTGSERLDESIDQVLNSNVEIGNIIEAGENDLGEKLYSIENEKSIEDYAKSATEEVFNGVEINGESAFEYIAEGYIEDRFEVSESVQENFSASDIIEFKEGNNEVISNGLESQNTEYLEFGENLAMFTNSYDQEEEGKIMTKEEAVEYGLENGFDKEDLARATSEELVEKIEELQLDKAIEQAYSQDQNQGLSL